ncbi:MAG TPA: tRNA (adenosine(37)-N6)-dimethylallyltransferase MiaA [Candidatus Saccharimonadales bacterium]|nr:tRNA (adenosine(37)-N6)-dimethylallyltransferase MiaA [Candidatus Saccharimonadales bacterium]
MTEVVAIVGPTASGKSAVALRAAEAFGGEIVSADSRQVYRRMDIGTAKPTTSEQARVRHHCIDVVDPGTRYDAARYQRDALAALADIATRGQRAYVVGGTGLYLRALLDGLRLTALPGDALLRAGLEARGAAGGGSELHRELARIDPAAAGRVDPRNVRRVIRYLEIATLAGGVPLARTAGVTARRIGLDPPRAELDARILARVRRMVEDGVLEETRALVASGLDPRLPSMSAHGYVHWAAHLRGELDLEAAVLATAKDVRAYARRQMTWFRRDPQVVWIDPLREDPLTAVRRLEA